MDFFKRKWPAILLWPLSLLYGSIVVLRHLCYKTGLFRSFKVPCRVISVGNISVGGTGKTPTVLFLAEYFSDKKVCILSRGYKRDSKGTVIVSDGYNVLASIPQAGDEPYMLACRLSNVPVVVDKNRVRGAQAAVERFKPDIILLDDGFQHRRLARDIDIVTVGFPRPFGNGFLLPAGPLREPVALLKRADVLWINSFMDKDYEIKKLKFVHTINAGYKPVEIRNNKNETIDGVRNLPVVGFCAIGNPAGFKKSLESLGVIVKKFINFRDHHMYTPEDIINIDTQFQSSQAQLVLTTEKDWVKLPVTELKDHWYFLKIDLEIKNIHVLKELRKKIG
ncbi:tetraacyldisaccharide 4'-kinase [candidate division KSB1 bacterium]|nr:tetraacyldisaccharide 4'-kinase [candidate division KSB1 bacterium]